MSDKKTSKRGRKPKKKPYFGKEQEEAVVEFMSYGETFLDPNKLDENGKPILCWSGSTQDESLRGKVYRDELKNTFNKLIEGIINTYGLHSKDLNYEQLHSDTLSFLMLKFYKFKPSKGKKSYSYYGTVCKNYLIGKLIKEDKKIKTSTSYEDISSNIEHDVKYSYTMNKDKEELTKFIISVCDNIKKELKDRVLSENEIKVGNSLVYILENWEDLFNSGSDEGKKYNKNLILLYMREMTSLTTKDIRNAMKRYKDIYKLLKDSL